ncbi:unnamed protein product [Diamesa serratosioi]
MPGDGYFESSFINPHICTHIVYRLIKASADGSLKIETDLDIENVVDLKSQNSKIKIIASDDMYYESAVFSKIAADSNSRRNFAINVAKYCRNNHFDGFHLSWFWPGRRGGNASIDKDNFSKLLVEMKRALGKDLSLSILAAGSKTVAKKSYDIPTINSIVEFICLSTHNFHGPSDNVTGVHGALYAGPDKNKELNVDASIKYWLSKGAAKEKLVVAISPYGITFTLKDSSQNGIGAATIGGGVPGPWSRLRGFLTYNEICMDTRWKRVWQPEQQSIYAINGNQWMSYEDIETASIKAEYIKQNSLGGAMFWLLNSDDSNGNCGQGRYPLISSVYKILMN